MGVQITNQSVPVHGKPLVRVPEHGFFTIPGVAAALHATGDALGIKFSLAVPRSGVIYTALLKDMAKQDLAVDLVLFSADFTGTADNDAFDMADADADKSAGTISWTASDIATFNDNAIGTLRNYGHGYVAPAGRLWMQMIDRGGITPAAVTDYGIALIIIPDVEITE